MAMPEMDAVKDAALKYDKPTLARLAQSGQISPTIAVMAGMMRDRIVQSEMKPPEQTVAEEVMQPMGQRMGLAAAQQMPQQMPQRAGQGLDQVPVPENMFDEQRMAGGGIVAFQNRGRVEAPSLGDALESALARMKQRDPSLNVDYVRGAIMQAPRDQQMNLIQQLIGESGAVPSAQVMPASFTQALSATDPRQADTGAQYGARAIPGSQILAQKADAAGNIYRTVGDDFDQADTGAQPGASVGPRDFPGSLILAQKADRAGNIYARPTPQAGIAALSQANAAPPQEAPFQVDPFSGTQTYEGYPAPVIADTTQTDTGAAARTGSPSTEMLRAESEAQAKRNAEAAAAAREAPKEPGIDQGSIMKRAGEMATGILGKPGAEGIKIPTVEEASKETADLLAASGFDSNLFKTLQSDITKQREAMKGDREEAMNLRLLEAGLGIMGGESPYAFVNIGKGATPAIKGLSEDIKGLKKAERELVNAERDLRMKENDFALGKARISQASIDKARERADKERSDYTRLQGDFAKTMLSGEIQKQIAKATYKATDFDKQWSLYNEEAIARGETPTWTGFMQSKQAGMTREDATRIAGSMESVKALDLSTPEGRREYENTVNFIMTQGRRPPPSVSTGPAPTPPKGFVIQ